MFNSFKTKFKKIKNLIPNSYTDKMILQKKFDNVKIFSRNYNLEKLKSDQYIYTHNIDTGEQRLCLLKGYYRIYIEIMYNYHYTSDRIGMCPIILIDEDNINSSIKKYIETTLMEEFKDKDFLFSKWSNKKEINKIKFYKKINL